MSAEAPAFPAAPAPATHHPERWLGALLLALAGVWFLTLDARHLLRSDEGRYAEIAREMLATGDWITIRYQGLKYFEKPPFQLWMTALAFKAFGVGEWQARWWVATAGAAGIGMTMLAARRWFGPRAGLIAGFVLLAAPAWNLGSHFNSLDMGVSGALAFVLGCTLIAQHPDASPSSQRGWMLGAWAAMGVAALTKGLIGIVLPGLVLVVYSAVARDLSLWRRLHILPGAALFLAIVEPWFVLVSQRNPEFLQFFFIHEHFQRYLSTVHQRSGPLWYFVPIALAGFAPWLALGPAMVRAVLGEPRAQRFRPLLFLTVWVLAIFAFFSVSSSKLPGYVLPIFPALAILAAVALEPLKPRSWLRLLLAAGVFVGLAMLAAPWLGRLAAPGPQAALYEAFSPWLLGAGVVAAIGLGLAFRIARQGRPGSIGVYAVSAFLFFTVVLRGHEVFGRASSGIDLIPATEAVLRPGMPIYSVRLLDHTVPFYLRRTMIMVEAPDELEFGVGREPDKWLPTLAAFEARWRTGPPAVALMAHDTYAALTAAGLPMVNVASDPRRVVVANFTPSPP